MTIIITEETLKRPSIQRTIRTIAKGYGYDVKKPLKKSDIREALGLATGKRISIKKSLTPIEQLQSEKDVRFIGREIRQTAKAKKLLSDIGL